MLLSPTTSPTTPSKSSRKSSIEPLRVEAFIDDLFGEDRHASRVLSLTNATIGVLGAAVLGVHAIGLALAEVCQVELSAGADGTVRRAACGECGL